MSSTLKIAIFCSLIFHLGLGAFLLVTRHDGPSLKHGTIAVDFIQSVPHGVIEDPHHHPGKKSKGEIPKPANTAASTPSLPQTEGDPNSIAKESDLYISNVSKLINARKIYPRRAVEREEEGRVVLGVSVDREGHIVAAKIEDPAPFDSLNQAALDTIKAVEKFPPLPDQVPDPIHLHIPLIFKIEGR